MQDGFHVALKRRIDEEIRNRSEALSQGMGVTSMEEYRNRLGYLSGLRDALVMASEVEKKLYGNPLNGDE